MQPPKSSPRPRPPSLVLIETEIARTEAACVHWRRRAEALEDAGRDGRSVRGMAATTEDRLSQLRRSREVLLHGEEGHGDDEPA